MTVTSHTISSPIGAITLTADDTHLVALDIDSQRVDSARPDHPILQQAARELDEYFSGTRTSFDVPVRLEGTPFQKAIWRALQRIPHGVTVTYGQLGSDAGFPGSARAVGGAVGKNPVPIIVPCHRVVGASGAMTGYSGGGGVATKRLLLSQEGAPAH